MIKQDEKLIGKLRTKCTLSARVSMTETLRGQLSKNTNYVNYTGDYEITPKVEAQTMRTKDRLMVNDVEIKGIPIFSTSNNSGGNTIYIAKEV